MTGEVVESADDGLLRVTWAGTWGHPPAIGSEWHVRIGDEHERVTVVGIDGPHALLLCDSQA